jgi:hypothetical protein
MNRPRSRRRVKAAEVGNMVGGAPVDAIREGNLAEALHVRGARMSLPTSGQCRLGLLRLETLEACRKFAKEVRVVLWCRGRGLMRTSLH